MDAELQRATIAGAASGVVGAIVFVTVHALWILPIWGILVMGVPLAAAAGAAAGWCYHVLGDRFPRGALRVVFVAWFFLFSVVPAQVGSMVRAPILSSEDFAPTRLEISSVVVELTLAAFLLGLLVGWAFDGSRRAALATGAAYFGFALTVGHNVPFIGNSPGVGKMYAIMAITSLAAAVVLVLGARPTTSSASSNRPSSASGP